MASLYTFIDYSPEWPSEFEREAERLAALLGDELVTVHHIGSTSVPGLAAKPIIDLLPLVRDIARVDERTAALQEAGYKAWGEYGLSGRRYFTKDRGEHRTHNVHVYQAGDPAIDRHLAFCAYLRSHEQVRDEYAALKRQVYALHPADIGAYNDGKDAWIKRVEEQALRWYRQQGARTSHEEDRPLEALVPSFRAFGFVVLRRFFDPIPLAAEIDRALREGLAPSSKGLISGEIRFQYVPMMSAETPVSLALLDRLEAVATGLLGGPVLPTRAKGVRYSGDTPWHTDSASPVASAGFAAYLEPLDAATGALRVLPGSHLPELGNAVGALGAAGMAAPALPGHAVVTEPGDVIAFDEHLYHASSGGGARRQWRADYVLDPVGAEAESHTKAYFASIFPPDWDGGHDVDRFASYGPDWLASGRPSVARLRALGVLDLAARQEAFSRSRR